jgi:acyl dehydratase
MWLYFAFGDLCRLRKHGSNRPEPAGKLTYFCNSSVMLELTGRRGCDTAGVNENGLSYFEDYVLGATYECGSVSVDQASILSFGKEFDPQPFHVDPVAAAAGPYGGLIASGWHTSALVMRLLVENYLSAESSLGSAGIDELRWPHPVRPGDTLRVRATVLESRRSLSKPDRGIVKTVIEAVNQDGRTVMRATGINFVLVRPDPGT